MPTFRAIQDTPTLLMTSVGGSSLAFPVPLSVFPRCQRRIFFSGEPRLTSRNRVDLLRQPAREKVPSRAPEAGRTTLDHNRSYTPGL